LNARWTSIPEAGRGVGGAGVVVPLLLTLKATFRKGDPVLADLFNRGDLGMCVFGVCLNGS